MRRAVRNMNSDTCWQPWLPVFWVEKFQCWPRSVVASDCLSRPVSLSLLQAPPQRQWTFSATKKNRFKLSFEVSLAVEYYFGCAVIQILRRFSKCGYDFAKIFPYLAGFFPLFQFSSSSISPPPPAKYLTPPPLNLSKNTISCVIAFWIN